MRFRRVVPTCFPLSMKFWRSEPRTDWGVLTPGDPKETKMSDDDEIKLRSGREIYAHGGILGISPDLGVTQGYDGRIIMVRPDVRTLAPQFAAATPDEVNELCDIAINRWQRLKTLVASLQGTRPEV